MRLAIGLCLMVLAAAPAASVSLGTIPVPPDIGDVDDIIERARAALEDGKYAEAGKMVEEALQKPGFERLSQPEQLRAILLASEAAEGREDYLAAHEYMAVATGFPGAKAGQWVMRARLATWIDNWADAGLAIKTVAKNWPAALADIHHETITWTAVMMSRDKKLSADRLELLNALFAAKFQLEWHSEPTELWRELVLDALQRNDLARARQVLERIDEPGTLVRMRIDRRFDAIVQAQPSSFDVAAAAQTQIRRQRREMDANPTKLGPVMRYMHALFTVGSYDQAISIADRALAKNANAPRHKPAYDDQAETLNWIYDLKSQALRALGRWDEALLMQQEARRQRENSNDKVSQAINLGSSYIHRDRPEDALRSIEGIDWARSLSGYGRMQLQHVRLRAYLQLGNRAEAEKVFAYQRENKLDAPGTWQEAMLEWGDVDEAAAYYITRLRDPEQRNQALYAAQKFKPFPRLPRDAADQARWEALLNRPDVTAAIDEVGRREQFAIYDLWL